MSERQPNYIKESERQDFDDKSNLDTARDSRTLGERALAIALRELGPEAVAEAALRAVEGNAEKSSARNEYQETTTIPANKATTPDRRRKIMSSSLDNESNVKKKRRSLFRRKKIEHEVPVELPMVKDIPLDSQLLEEQQLLPGERDSYYPIQVPIGADEHGDSVTIKIPISYDTSRRLDIVKLAHRKQRQLSGRGLGAVKIGYENLTSEALDYESRVKDAIEKLKAKKKYVQKEVYENTMEQLELMLKAAVELYIHSVIECSECKQLVKWLPSELGELYSFAQW